MAQAGQSQTELGEQHYIQIIKGKKKLKMQVFGRAAVSMPQRPWYVEGIYLAKGPDKDEEE